MKLFAVVEMEEERVFRVGNFQASVLTDKNYTWKVQAGPRRSNADYFSWLKIHSQQARRCLQWSRLTFEHEKRQLLCQNSNR